MAQSGKVEGMKTLNQMFILEQTRTIDNQRIKSDILTSLSNAEIIEAEMLWQTVLGFD